MNAFAITDLALTLLTPHPQNPRLMIRQDVVDQIAAHIKHQGTFDPAHALIVRPQENGTRYEIISGSHRWLAAQAAGLETVPCWVREMSDEDAYMNLVLDNTQGELHPLEEGMHALRSTLSGGDIKAYAAQTGKSYTTLMDKVYAARVRENTNIRIDDAYQAWLSLSTIHRSPEWLWPALVEQMTSEHWTVERTRDKVKRVQNLAAPPPWSNKEQIACLVASEDMRIQEVATFATMAEACQTRLTRNAEDAERFITVLTERLTAACPSRLSEVEALCVSVEDEQRALIQERRQADLFLRQREEQVRARIVRLRQAVSLEEWQTLKPDEQHALLHLSPHDIAVSRFNKQENTAIEWAQWSYNPVTGCLHNCPYCLGEQTPILMADLSWRAIGDLQIGDAICGVLPPGMPPCSCNGYPAYDAKSPHLVHAQVTAVMQRKAAAACMTVRDTRLVCSWDHRWLEASLDTKTLGWSCLEHLFERYSLPSFLATVGIDVLRSQALPSKVDGPEEQRHKVIHDLVAAQAQPLTLKQHYAYPIDDIEPLPGEQWLCDITTSTSNFITAGGLISHNCYARDDSENPRMQKIYPYGFAPTLHPARLLIPRHMTVPPEAITDTRYKNVFTCSMADLFGRWVPSEWIEAVFQEMRDAPQWNFLCLTKFPKRLTEFSLPANAWMGTTVDLQARVKAAEDAFEHITTGVRWLSLEPLLEPLHFTHLERFQWMVIGGASPSSQTPAWTPPFAWIEDLLRQADDAGCKVYFKTNLLGKRRLELPFNAPVPGEDGPAPAVFHYLKPFPAPDA